MPFALPLELAVFLVGLLFGSFLNVCISRLPRGESIVRPRSHCKACGATIRWYDNLPLVSWFALRGRCRHCKAPIPWRYPVVECGTALWFLLSFIVTVHALQRAGMFDHPDLATRLLVQGLGTLCLGFFLIGLMVMDWQTQILPDAFTLSGAALGFLLTCVQAMFLGQGEGDLHFSPHNSMRMSSPGSFAAHGDVFLTGPEALVLGRLAAILGAASVLLLIRATYKALRGREGMGLGDAKLLAMIAGFLGFSDAMISFFFGMIACASYAVVLLLRGKANATTKLPLGSFLAAGGLFTALLGEAVLTWYKGLL